MSNRGPCQGQSFRPQDFHAGYQAQVTQDRRITLITGQDMPNPDSESSLLVEALASLGVDSEVVVWREKRDWSAARLIVLRSPWDYADHLTGFLAWVTHVASVSHLRNSADVVRWNVNKATCSNWHAMTYRSFPQRLLLLAVSSTRRASCMTLQRDIGRKKSSSNPPSASRPTVPSGQCRTIRHWLSTCRHC
jgi:hypothetical protein